MLMEKVKNNSVTFPAAKYLKETGVLPPPPKKQKPVWFEAHQNTQLK
jgi:hypothetical protein